MHCAAVVVYTTSLKPTEERRSSNCFCRLSSRTNTFNVHAANYGGIKHSVYDAFLPVVRRTPNRQAATRTQKRQRVSTHSHSAGFESDSPYFGSGSRMMRELPGPRLSNQRSLQLCQSSSHIPPCQSIVGEITTKSIEPVLLSALLFFQILRICY